jgi:Methyltransferase domain
MLKRVTTRLARAARSLLPAMQRDSELLEHVKQSIVPLQPREPDVLANMPRTMLGAPGIDLVPEEQLAWIASLRSDRHQELFRVLRADSAINKFLMGQQGISNTFCNTPDAEIYASMIVERKPRKVVEIGSGFSTRVAREAIKFSGHQTKLVVIDPFPRTDVKSAADELNLLPVEQVDLLSGWQKDDLLFIDSSHICRTRGDIPYLFCSVIPSLPSGALIHVHDIFIPYDYPNLYDQWCHTEQYLLACMLSHSSRYRVVLATHWLSRNYPEQMNAAFGPFSGTGAMSPNHFGCSFWFEVR